MKNYELIALLMELPAGYDIKFGKTVTKEDMNGEEAIFSKKQHQILKAMISNRKFTY